MVSKAIYLIINKTGQSSMNFYSLEGFQVREQVRQAPGEGRQVRFRQPAEGQGQVNGRKRHYKYFDENPATKKPRRACCNGIFCANASTILNF